MLVRLRRDSFNLTLPFLQFGLIACASYLNTRWGYFTALTLVIAIALFGWLRSVRHARLILDTPTSRIASAAQGYVELRGHGKPLDGSPLLSPVTGLPVLWYRLQTFRKQYDGKWRHESTVESDASFLLDDGSGVCAVDPEHAEMLVRRRDVDERGELRHVQWCLLRNDPVYLLGEFTTLGSIAPDFNAATQVRELLAHWKADRASLLRRFDLDGDGEINLAEWEHARSAARREVEGRRNELLAAPEAHVVRAPRDGRLYLISDLDPARIARRYRLWAGFHLALFLGSLAAWAWFQQISAF